MKIVNVYEAKTRLSQLLDLAASGEKVVIIRAGRSMAKLIRSQVSPKSGKPGCSKGKVKISKDFDQLPENFSRGSI